MFTSSSPLISVVMPARNEQRFILKSLRSVVAQSIRDIEIVVVDDGSTDATPDIVAAMARQDPRIRLVPSDGTGVAGAGNTGIRAARGRWIARCDADDLFMKGKLLRQLAEIDAHPELVAVGTAGWEINERGLPLRPFKSRPSGPADYRLHRAEGRLMRAASSSLLFRRDVALDVDLCDQDYFPAEDLDFLNKLAAAGPLWSLPKPLLWYRVRRDSTTAQRTLDMVAQTVRVEQRVASGKMHATFEDFREAMVRQDGAWSALSAQAADEARNRQIARTMVNGDFRTGLRLAHQEWGTRGAAQRITRRILIGRW